MKRYGDRGRLLLCATVLLAAGAGRASAQAAPVEPRPLAVGDRVRVTFEDATPRVQGPVSALDDTSISVVRRRSEAVTLAYRDIRAVHRHEGRATSARGALRGAAWGLGIGAGAGALLTASVYLSRADEQCGDCFIEPTGLAVAATFLIAVGSTGIGAVVGAFNPPERWRRVGIPGRVGVAPFGAGGRAGIAVVARF